LPGLARALVSAGKLGQKSAEDIYRKAQANRTSFIAELTGSGAVSAADLAHTMSTAFGAPLLDLDAIDVQRLPKACSTPRSARPTAWWCCPSATTG
jgi:type IV pilus assembly protein PilB